MNYFTIQPPQHLAEYVRFFWVLEGEASLDNPYTHRSMADGCAELLFHYNGIFDELVQGNSIESSFQSGIGGQSQIVRRFIIKNNFGIFGAYLYPFAVSQLFSLPATELSNQMIDLQTLLGKEAHELNDKIMLARDNPSRARILSGFLEKKLPKIKKPQPGVFETIRHIITTNGMTNVEELAKRNFLSTRHFERNFKRFAGFSPKLFSRIIRFQSAVSYYGKKEKNLTSIAYDAGYYDQS
ncbi:MAG: helix-turn-helix transcriptional regulator, partial [Ferruginibacter sp.]|nr:helix-turn-helix transcriptional regulator [Chitinophagaceae bacterium]